MGKGLLAACLRGACPLAKGAQREVSYRHKECACELLHKELREAYLYRRAVTVAHQKKDTEETEE